MLAGRTLRGFYFNPVLRICKVEAQNDQFLRADDRSIASKNETLK